MKNGLTDVALTAVGAILAMTVLAAPAYAFNMHVPRSVLASAVLASSESGDGMVCPIGAGLGSLSLRPFFDQTTGL